MLGSIGSLKSRLWESIGIKWDKKFTEQPKSTLVNPITKTEIFGKEIKSF